MPKFVMKHVPSRRIDKPTKVVKQEEAVNNNDKTLNEVMTTSEKVELARQALSDAPKVKRVKKDKGLIERTESSKTILTEDNRELLND